LTEKPQKKASGSPEKRKPLAFNKKLIMKKDTRNRPKKQEGKGGRKGGEIESRLAKQARPNLEGGSQ
jgi:hypothetical protein